MSRPLRTIADERMYHLREGARNFGPASTLAPPKTPLGRTIRRLPDMMPGDEESYDGDFGLLGVPQFMGTAGPLVSVQPEPGFCVKTWGVDCGPGTDGTIASVIRDANTPERRVKVCCLGLAPFCLGRR